MMEEPNASKSAQFVNELAQFYRNKGQFGVTSKHMTVRLDGQDIDLWDLYSAVLEFGGSFRVNQHSLWDEVYIKVFRRRPTGVNASVALRQVYKRYLMPYERVHCSNFVHDNGNDDDDDSKSALQSNRDQINSFVIHSSLTSHPQSHQQHLQQHLASLTANPVTKVICSLVSGLSNEMDFGLKIVTMLVNSRQYNAIADYRFVDILLECCSLHACNCDQESLPLQVSPSKRHHRHRSLQETDSRLPSSRLQASLSSLPPTKKCLCFQRFWSRVCPDPSVLGLIFEDSLEECKSLQDNNDDQMTSILENEPHFKQSEQQEKQSNLIKRIASLIRSITEFMQEVQESEEEPDVESCPLRLLKFTVLLMSSHDIDMKSLALDILSNVSLNPVHSSDTEVYTSLETLICSRAVSFVFEDQDTDIVNRSLRCLSHLLSSASDENIKIYKNCIDTSFLNRLIELLTCQHDVSLLVSALELCWSISEVSPKLLLSANCSHLIKILLNLINCDIATHFGIDALKRIRLSDTHVRSSNQVTRVIINPQPTQVTSNVNVGKPIIVATQPIINQTTASESEAFLITWLKNTFDVTAGKTGQVISINDMFAAYIKFACNSGRRSVINAQSFAQVILKAFPSVTVNGSQVEGILPKTTTVHFVPPAVNAVQQTSVASTPVCSTPKKTETTEPESKNPLTSPILKAHLSAPPKTSPSGQASPVPVATNVVASTTAGTTPTSSLIKSLLASKLRNNSVSTKLDFGDSSSDPSSPITKKDPEVKIEAPVVSTVPLIPTSTVTTSSVPVVQTTPQKVTMTSSIMTSNPNLIITSAANSVSMPQAVLNSSQQPVLISTNTLNNCAVTPGQQPQTQQFLLVRMTGAGGQQQLVGMPTGGPVRFILPASVLSQQRPVPQVVNVNGVVNAAQPMVVSTTAAPKITPVMTPSTAITINPTPKTTGSDILLKAVLGSGIVPETQQPNTPTKPVEEQHAVKSSPLLNVLLDKGTSGSTTSQTSPVQQQPQKMICILTTNPGVAVKPPPSSESIQIGLKNGSSSEVIVNNTIHKSPVVPHTVNLTVNCSDGHALTNGVVSDELCLDEKKLGSSLDLSPIKDIQKAMDDATKQISQKRPNEDDDNSNAKKMKVALKEPTNDIISDTTPVNTPINEIISSTTPVNTPVNGDVKTPPKTSPNNTTAPSEPQLSSPTKTAEPASSDIPPSNGHVLSVVTTPAPTTLVPVKLEFVCEWNGCKKSFTKATQVFTHVYSTHVFVNCSARTAAVNDVVSCEWGGLHGMGPGCQSKRPRLSLLTHLQDFHCNPALLHQTAMKRIQLGAPPTVNVALSQPPPAHPGYAKNAALLAIKRHAINYIEPWPTLGQTPTAPVTVSVRLTAALIIRNLALISGDVRRWLQRHESYLSELTMNFGRDESRTIAQCLSIIQSSGWKRKEK